MNLEGKQVAILGAGITGLAAAGRLAALGLDVTMIERTASAGGHTALFNCKAVDGCVRCGACTAREMLTSIDRFPNIRILSGARITRVEHKHPFSISYEDHAGSGILQCDAILLATGFRAYDPSEKPYGYGKLPGVITNLEAEAILKTHGVIKRPSDGFEPVHLAFIQCVGSRDSRLRHPWCSKICCGSALRMARLIQHRQPQTQVTFFYIDVQTFGRNFQAYYEQTQKTVHMTRAIPGDIFETVDHQLQVTYFDPQSRQAGEAVFDMVILSVGLTPDPGNTDLARLLDWPLNPWGFFFSHRDEATSGTRGIFTAGAALGPMSIAESIDSAGHAGRDIVQFLGTC